MQMEFTQMDTLTASPAELLDPETRRDITIKLTLASLAAQQGRTADAFYWTDRARTSLDEFKESQTAA